METSNKRSTDEAILGWLHVGQAIVSIGLTIAMGLNALKHFYGFDLFSWVRNQIAQWKMHQMILAWHREHAQDGLKSEEMEV